MVSVNLEAKKTVDVMIEKADDLNIAVSKLGNGATVIDCGVNVEGSFKAGELYTKVCLGGLADVGISTTQPTGNSGPRIGCGVIMKTQP